MITWQGLFGVCGATLASRQLFYPLVAELLQSCLPSQPLPQAVPVSSSNFGAQNITDDPVKIPEGAVLLLAFAVGKASVWGHEMTFSGVLIFF